MQELARWLNPAAASPSAPRETVAALDAFGPSLMPRTATLHGVAMGLGMLGARATTGVVEKLTRLAVPADASLPSQLVARAVIGGAGACDKRHAVPQRLAGPSQHILLLGIAQIVDIASVHIDGVHQAGAMSRSHMFLKGLDGYTAVSLVRQQCRRDALHFAAKLSPFNQRFDRHS